MFAKAKRRILQAWNNVVGSGYQMLQRAVSLSKGSTRDHFLNIVKQKVDLYGSSIYSSADDDAKKTVKAKSGLLSSLAQRYGQLSPKRGELLLDALHSNLILFMEDYKKELPIPQVDSKRLEIAREYCRKLQPLRHLSDQSFSCLKLFEGTTHMVSSTNDIPHLLKMASESLEVLKKICSRVQKNPSKILEELNDYWELYSCHDVKFLDNFIIPSRTRNNPFRTGIADELEFEVDGDHRGPDVFKFGAISSSTSSCASSQRSNGSRFANTNPSRFASTRKKYANPAGRSPGAGGSFSSPFNSSSASSNSTSFFESFLSSDEEDNPFGFGGGDGSGSGKFRNHARTSTDRAERGEQNEDWSSYFWLSSDDADDDDDFDIDDLLEDGLKDFGASGGSSAKPGFGEDIFNTEELDELAEWATMQFMMSRMK